MIDRSLLLAALIARVEKQLSTKTQAAHAVRSEATDQEARSENKYDTRSLETSYLARGQAMQVEAMAEELLLLRGFTCPPDASSPVASLGRLVQHKVQGMPSWYFLLPAAGGMRSNAKT